jgi:hypothetical protein
MRSTMLMGAAAVVVSAATSRQRRTHLSPSLRRRLLPFGRRQCDVGDCRNTTHGAFGPYLDFYLKALFAADLPVAPSSAPIPVSIPNWTGPYIGLVGMRYDAPSWDVGCSLFSRSI